MTDEYKRNTRLLAQSFEKFDHVCPNNRIQSGDHLVTQQDLRRGGKCTGQIDTLFLTSRQFFRIASGKLLRQFDHIQQFADATAFFISLKAKIKLQRPPENIIDTLAGIKRRIRHLKNKLDFLKLFTFSLLKCRLKLLSIQQHLSVGGGQQTRHHPGQRGLATT